ncbi:hypothetical protein VTO42DRAFT_3582 [Malbranchea cinnamomea]
MEQRRSSGRLKPITTNNANDDELSTSFNQLSLQAANHATGSEAVSSPMPSPSQSPHQPMHNRSVSRHEHIPSSASRRMSAPRRTPSSNSLREDRRASIASLHKKVSVTSLRSAAQNTPGGGNPSSPRVSLSRKSSSNFLNSPSATRPRTPFHAAEMRPLTPPPTASSIAAEHFAKEIALHQAGDLQSKTVVIIQDACYGHRFSRPGASKAELGSIVERPERMRAAVLGISAAYVRMGKRYEGGRYAPHPDLDIQSLPIPPFQIRKTARSVPLSSPAVTHVHGVKWMDELKEMCDAAESRLALNGKELVRPRGSSSKENCLMNEPRELHEGDLYLCSESLNALEGALGGVCEAVDYVFGPGNPCRAFVNIRPPGHHCSADHPSGFCWLNNVHVGIAHAAMTHGLTHAAIIDFDLHHGDGSQSIAWEQNRKAAAASKNVALHKTTAIGYFSLHDINSFPCEDGEQTKVTNASVCIDNAHGQSIWNVHLEPWKTVQEFWDLYNTKYIILLEKARAFLRLQTQRLLHSPNSPPPKAAIFLSAGFDASEWESVGMQRHKVNVPTDFYARFTADIVQLSQEEGLAVDGRVISVLEGGYSDRALTSGVLSHLCGLADTRSSANQTTADHGSRLAFEIARRLDLSDQNSSPISSNSSEGEEEAVAAFDKEWWTASMLEELESQTRPKPVPVRKHIKNMPAYTAPTQASTAKAVESVRQRLSAGGYQYSMDEAAQGPHPIPSVDWATAAFELSKALIPTDRTTTSCQLAELKEAARIRQQRVSANAAELQASTSDRWHMQLRERKPKTAAAAEDLRPVSRVTRRTTIAAVSDLPEPVDNVDEIHAEIYKPTQDGSSRRLSVSSTVISATSSVKSASQRKGRSAAGSRRSNKDNDNPARSSSSTDSKSREKMTRPALGARAATSAGVQSDLRKPSGNVASRPGSAQESPPPEPLAEAKGADNRDLDSLTQGVKKLRIKLKMPTPEEHAARIQAAEEEMRKARSNVKIVKATKAPLFSESRSKKGSRAVSGPNRSARESSTTTQDTASGEETKLRSTNDSSPSLAVVPPAASRESEPLSNDQPKINEPCTAHGRDDITMPSPPLTPSSVQEDSSRPTATADLNSPNTTPQPKYGKDRLPVFTPTSVIPFGPASSSLPSAYSRDENSGDTQ